MVDGALGTLDITLSKRDMIGFASRVFHTVGAVKCEYASLIILMFRLHRKPLQAEEATSMNFPKSFFL